MFRKVILPLSLPGVLSGITMVFVPSVSTFAISRMLGGGTELLKIDDALAAVDDFVAGKLGL